MSHDMSPRRSPRLLWPGIFALVTLSGLVLYLFADHLSEQVWRYWVAGSAAVVGVHLPDAVREMRATRTR